jgi:hypothetical protein
MRSRSRPPEKRVRTPATHSSQQILIASRSLPDNSSRWYGGSRLRLTSRLSSLKQFWDSRLRQRKTVCPLELWTRTLIALAKDVTAVSGATTGATTATALDDLIGIGWGLERLRLVTLIALVWSTHKETREVICALTDGSLLLVQQSSCL